MKKCDKEKNRKHILVNDELHYLLRVEAAKKRKNITVIVNEILRKELVR